MSASRPAFTLRPASREDVPALLSLIRGLAVYEKLGDQVVATEADLQESLFGPRPAAEAVLADVNGRSVGFALFFQSFSTFLGKPGLYLEDLFVEPEFRGCGVGAALFRHVAGIAASRGCGRFEWAALDWNEPAIEFYRRRGAIALDEWTVYRLTGAALTAAASKT